ncbi:type IV pilin [Halorhabdus rudnickae]|uniref:type IV pilin n=1 Tax=Halorhabdus rudnickae TaxID=1775544 RepID=UPI00108370CB|nr:type IV pilin N-terminal domain-containing protein [Halorhabdus rudnickae]
MTSVIGIILLVAVTVIVAGTVTVFVFDLGSGLQPKAPYVETSHELVGDSSEQTIAITLEAGDRVPVDRLYVAGSKPVDIGGAPGSGRAADDAHASPIENFTETPGGTPQVAIGETWDAGETVYVDPKGSVDGVTVSVYWISGSIEGYNPGEPSGDDSYRLTSKTIRRSD